MNNNLTFWEYKRWNFINYLKDIDFKSIDKRKLYLQQNYSALLTWLFFFRVTFQKKSYFNTPIWEI
jgi:hypothetical protein